MQKVQLKFIKERIEEIQRDAMRDLADRAIRLEKELDDIKVEAIQNKYFALAYEPAIKDYIRSICLKKGKYDEVSDLRIDIIELIRFDNEVKSELNRMGLRLDHVHKLEEQVKGVTDSYINACLCKDKINDDFISDYDSRIRDILSLDEEDKEF